ncbi:MAG: hypothetical protein H7176_11540 [Bdellovibrionales bacterium]|nr:hypothetical protein [Massilia sp.]
MLPIQTAFAWRAQLAPSSVSGVRFLDHEFPQTMKSIDVALRSWSTTGRQARSEAFAIVLVLDGNKDMVTIPPKKKKVQQGMSKKFCGATPMNKSTISSLSRRHYWSFNGAIARERHSSRQGIMIVGDR